MSRVLRQLVGRRVCVDGSGRPVQTVSEISAFGVCGGDATSETMADRHGVRSVWRWVLPGGARLKARRVMRTTRWVASRATRSQTG